MKKKGAMELSVGTIVVIVIAMLTLVLGIILVKNIFGKSISNVDRIDARVKDEIDKMFEREGVRAVIRLPNDKLVLRKGKDWGVAFAIRNDKTGSAEADSFTYHFEAVKESAQKNCHVSKSAVESWIVTGITSGKKGVNIPPGRTYYDVVRFKIPEDAPLCIVRFHFIVERNGKDYATLSFDVQSK